MVVSGYDFSPIKRAANGIGQTLITSVASLIVALAAAVPWLPVIVLVLWGRSMEFSPLAGAQGLGRESNVTPHRRPFPDPGFFYRLARPPACHQDDRPRAPPMAP